MSFAGFIYNFYKSPKLILSAFILIFLIANSFIAFPSVVKAGNTKITLAGNKWYINGKVTNPGTVAEGLLMNVRMVNSVFEDDRPKSQWPNSLPQDFDPSKNTDVFIAKLPEYVQYGMLGFTVSLQGGNPGYEGAHNSAFNSNGSLRSAYMERVERVINAADARGAVVILSAFYQRQHGQDPTYNPRALDGKTAIRAAVVNVASWIKNKGFTNVVFEISNEYGHSGYSKWNDGDWLRSASGQIELINLAQSTHPGLLVSTSGMGNATINSSIANAADFILIHTNNTALSDYPSRISALKTYGKPIVINEDDKLGSSGAQAAQLSVDNGAGWGFMHSKKNQYAPFEYDGAADDTSVYNKVKALSGGGEQQPIDDTFDVVVTNPNDGDVFVLGDAVQITASPTAPSGGTITKVEFFANTQKVGERTSTPWSLQWTPSSEGLYDIWARAHDNDGKTADSPKVDITVVLSSSPTPTPALKPGDANEDGKVDGLDYVIWLNNYGTTTTLKHKAGDFDGNGKVDGLDYVIWLNNYGK
jgi:hypothetical protein